MDGPTNPEISKPEPKISVIASRLSDLETKVKTEKSLFITVSSVEEMYQGLKTIFDAKPTIDEGIATIKQFFRHRPPEVKEKMFEIICKNRNAEEVEKIRREINKSAYEEICEVLDGETDAEKIKNYFDKALEILSTINQEENQNSYLELLKLKNKDHQLDLKDIENIKKQIVNAPDRLKDGILRAIKDNKPIQTICFYIQPQISPVLRQKIGNVKEKFSNHDMYDPFIISILKFFEKGLIIDNFGSNEELRNNFLNTHTIVITEENQTEKRLESFNDFHRINKMSKNSITNVLTPVTFFS